MDIYIDTWKFEICRIFISGHLHVIDIYFRTPLEFDRTLMNEPSLALIHKTVVDIDTWNSNGH